jgi:hypothetical protein
MPTAAYYEALGKATYAFACADFAMFYVITDFHPPLVYAGHVDRPARKHDIKTPGTFAKDLTAALNKARLPAALDSSYRDFVKRYIDLTRRRNGLLHAWPYTAANNAQQLGGYYHVFEPNTQPTHNRVEWDMQELTALINESHACATMAGVLRHSLAAHKNGNPKP